MVPPAVWTIVSAICVFWRAFIYVFTENNVWSISRTRGRLGARKCAVRRKLNLCKHLKMNSGRSKGRESARGFRCNLNVSKYISRRMYFSYSFVDSLIFADICLSLDERIVLYRGIIEIMKLLNADSRSRSQKTESSQANKEKKDSRHGTTTWRRKAIRKYYRYR